MGTTSSADDARALLILRLLFTALVLLQVMGALLPGTILWGVDSLAYAPAAVRVAWPLVALILLWSPAGAWLGSVLVHRIAPLLHRRLSAYFLIPMLGAVVFWLSRTRTHFLGDGYLLAGLLAQGRPFHGFDFIDYALHAALFRLLGLSGESAALQLYAIASAVAGGLYLAIAAWCARLVSRNDAQRVLLFILLTVCASAEMFMGYVESYSLLMICTLLFGSALVLHAAGRVSAAVPAGAIGLGLLFHLNAIFLAPMLLWIIFRPSERDARSLGGRILRAVCPALAGLLLGAALLALAGYNRQWLHDDFAPAEQARTLWVGLHGPWGLLSWIHWKDILNLCVLLIPVPLAVLIAERLWRNRTAGGRAISKDLSVLLVISVWLLAWMSVLHLRLGVARDWDLFAPFAPIFALAAFMALRPRLEGVRAERLLGLVASIALILALPWYAVNAREQTGLNRFRSILADQSPYARAYAREEVGRYLRNQGRFPEALAEYRAAAEIAPHNPRLLVSMAELEYRSGRADAALATLSRALEENPDHGPGLELSARILAERGQAADALAMYARAVGAAPERTDLAERLVTLMLQAQGVAATQAGLRDALRTEPSSRLARTCLALALWLPIRANPAAGATPAGRQDLREALRLLEELASRHALNDHLSRVAADLRTTIARSPSPE